MDPPDTRADDVSRKGVQEEYNETFSPSNGNILRADVRTWGNGRDPVGAFVSSVKALQKSIYPS